jgi:hypothetical protein
MNIKWTKKQIGLYVPEDPTIKATVENVGCNAWWASCGEHESKHTTIAAAKWAVANYLKQRAKQ